MLLLEICVMFICFFALVVRTGKKINFSNHKISVKMLRLQDICNLRIRCVVVFHSVVRYGITLPSAVHSFICITQRISSISGAAFCSGRIREDNKSSSGGFEMKPMIEIRL